MATPIGPASRDSGGPQGVSDTLCFTLVQPSLECTGDRTAQHRRSKDERHDGIKHVRKTRVADGVLGGAWFRPFPKAILLVLSICSRQSVGIGNYAAEAVPVMAELQPRNSSAGYRLIEGDDGVVLTLRGDWTVLNIGAVASRLEHDLADRHSTTALDVRELGRIDSAGAYLLKQALKTPEAFRDCGRDDLSRLFDLVEPVVEDTPRIDQQTGSMRTIFVRIGMAVEGAGLEAYRMMDFGGRLVVALGRTLSHPHRLRLTPLFAVMEEAGVNGIPIVMTMCFFIGAIVALVGANLLTTLGVSVFTVQLVGVAILREFGVVIAAILFAGRSASAFAAQIGSMRMNQEVDAMQVMGVDQFDALVVPRVVAALLMLPLLAFCGDIGGIFGGLLVSWATMSINPVFFFRRMVETVNITHFWIGMSKAPFLALMISAAGCRHGLATGGDTESLGRRVTTAVVQSVFMIIMFDAIFAVIFMELDL